MGKAAARAIAEAKMNDPRVIGSIQKVKDCKGISTTRTT
jgi:hypothetical protein